MGNNDLALTFRSIFIGLTSAAIVKEHSGSELAIVFYPSFVSKPGKNTAGVGNVWSDCAGEVKRRFEFCSIAAIDLANHTAMHLLAVQTILQEGNFFDFYVRCIIDMVE